MKINSLDNLSVLKQIICLQSELSMNDIGHCIILKGLIGDVTGMNISLIAIQRLFGFTPSKFLPSLYTLNTLAFYCGYGDWETFTWRFC